MNMSDEMENQIAQDKALIDSFVRLIEHAGKQELQAAIEHIRWQAHDMSLPVIKRRHYKSLLPLLRKQLKEYG